MNLKKEPEIACSFYKPPDQTKNILEKPTDLWRDYVSNKTVQHDHLSLLRHDREQKVSSCLAIHFAKSVIIPVKKKTCMSFIL